MLDHVPGGTRRHRELGRRRGTFHLRRAIPHPLPPPRPGKDRSGGAERVPPPPHCVELSHGTGLRVKAAGTERLRRPRSAPRRPSPPPSLPARWPGPAVPGLGLIQALVGDSHDLLQHVACIVMRGRRRRPRWGRGGRIPGGGRRRRRDPTGKAHPASVRRCRRRQQPRRILHDGGRRGRSATAGQPRWLPHNRAQRPQPPPLPLPLPGPPRPARRDVPRPFPAPPLAPPPSCVGGGTSEPPVPGPSTARPLQATPPRRPRPLGPSTACPVVGAHR